MRVTAVLGLYLLGIASAAAFAAPPADSSFVGEWTATATTPSGSSVETLTVMKLAKGYSLTAKPAQPVPEGMEAGPGVDIVLDGDKFSFKRTVTAPGGVIVISYTGVVSGDTFTGTAEIGAAKVPYNGVRIKGSG